MRRRGVGAKVLPRGVGSEVRARGTLDMRLTQIAEDVKIALKESAEEVLRVTKGNCPVDSGDLQESLYISMLEERGPFKWRIEIIAPKPYAAAQERGSGLKAEPLPGILIAPIPILPTKGKVLTFFWPGGPAYLFQYRHTFTAHLPIVMSEGVPPTRFMRDSLKETSENVWTRIYRASAGRGV